MKCKYCGSALSKNVAYCPNCKRMLSDEQLQIRKELNGYNNPYMERLNKLGQDKIKYNLKPKEEPKTIKQLLVILLILLGIIVLSYMFLIK